MSGTIPRLDTAVSRTKFQPYTEGQIRIKHTSLYSSFSHVVFPADPLPF